MTTQSRSLHLADELASHPYQWPGMYPRFAITSDCLPLCSTCCREERTSIATTTGADGWCIVAIETNYEDTLYCANCSNQIESAYGSDLGDPNGSEESLTAAERNPSLAA